MLLCVIPQRRRGTEIAEKGTVNGSRVTGSDQSESLNVNRYLFEINYDI